MSYHVYWHWKGIGWLMNCSEAKAYAKFYRIRKGASRIMVHDNKIIEHAGPTNQFKYMLAREANRDGKLPMPYYNKVWVVHHWHGVNAKSFNSKDNALVHYGGLPNDASRAIIWQGKIIRNGGPSNDWKKAAIGWIFCPAFK